MQAFRVMIQTLKKMLLTPNRKSLKVNGVLYEEVELHDAGVVDFLVQTVVHPRIKLITN